LFSRWSGIPRKFWKGLRKSENVLPRLGDLIERRQQDITGSPLATICK